jgi:hypothetical protein
LKLIDGSVPEQSFIEDCEVCCNPIEFTASISYGSILAFCAEPIGQ